MFFSFFSPKITIKDVEIFYKYAEVGKCMGRSDRRSNAFGHGYSIEYSRKNNSYIYNGIRLYGDRKWGFISVKDGEVIFQYTENSNQLGLNESPITTDKKIIRLMTKLFWKWYKELNLPKAIETLENNKNKQTSVSVIREVTIDNFDEEYPPVLRIMDDGTTYLIFGIFPPRNKKMTTHQIENLAKTLTEITGKKVIQDDRELFLIFDNSEKMIDEIILFLQRL